MQQVNKFRLNCCQLTAEENVGKGTQETGPGVGGWGGGKSLSSQKKWRRFSSWQLLFGERALTNSRLFMSMATRTWGSFSQGSRLSLGLSSRISSPPRSVDEEMRSPTPDGTLGSTWRLLPSEIWLPKFFAL